MPTILDSLASTFSPDVMGDIGKALGADTLGGFQGDRRGRPAAAVRHDETGDAARRRRIAHEVAARRHGVFSATSAAC